MNRPLVLVQPDGRDLKIWFAHVTT
jgi:hypothetical protein